jgi:hypothetical protein
MNGKETKNINTSIKNTWRILKAIPILQENNLPITFPYSYKHIKKKGLDEIIEAFLSINHFRIL